MELRCADHCAVLDALAPSSVSLVVFNLGYLPGGDKALVTTAEGTVRALRAAERAVRPGGCVSVTGYPGHAEGAREEQAVLEHAAALPQGQWSVHYTVSAGKTRAQCVRLPLASAAPRLAPTP